MTEIYPHDYQEAEPRHFDPGSEFHQRREWGNYSEPHNDNGYDRDPRHNPYRGQNSVYRPYDSNDDSYPHYPSSRSYRARADSPHVTFNPIMGPAPPDHGYGPESVPYPRRGPPPPSPATAYDAMRRWNLRFSGARDEDPEDYLHRIIEGRSVIPVANEVILWLLPFFLSGIALSWYRVNQSRWRDFSRFAAAFRSRFGDSDFQLQLRQEIHRRTQGEREPAADYLMCMMALFNRLEPRMTEAEELSYADRNLLPNGPAA